MAAAVCKWVPRDGTRRGSSRRPPPLLPTPRALLFLSLSDRSLSPLCKPSCDLVPSGGGPGAAELQRGDGPAPLPPQRRCEVGATVSGGAGRPRQGRSRGGMHPRRGRAPARRPPPLRRWPRRGERGHACPRDPPMRRAAAPVHGAATAAVACLLSVAGRARRWRPPRRRLPRLGERASSPPHGPLHGQPRLPRLAVHTGFGTDEDGHRWRRRWRPPDLDGEECGGDGCGRSTMGRLSCSVSAPAVCSVSMVGAQSPLRARLCLPMRNLDTSCLPQDGLFLSPCQVQAANSAPSLCIYVINLDELMIHLLETKD